MKPTDQTGTPCPFAAPEFEAKHAADTLAGIPEPERKRIQGDGFAAWNKVYRAHYLKHGTPDTDTVRAREALAADAEQRAIAAGVAAYRAGQAVSRADANCPLCGGHPCTCSDVAAIAAIPAEQRAEATRACEAAYEAHVTAHGAHTAPLVEAACAAGKRAYDAVIAHHASEARAKEALAAGLPTMAVPARLDTDRTATPLTRIVHHPAIGDCVGPGTALRAPEYEDEHGHRTALTEAVTPSLPVASERWQAAEIAYLSETRIPPTLMGPQRCWEAVVRAVDTSAPKCRATMTGDEGEQYTCSLPPHGTGPIEIDHAEIGADGMVIARWTAAMEP